MKIIGVTGGVGAGKSTVLNYLEKRYGAKLILADLVGHEVMEPGHEAYEQVVKVFGQEIVSEDKTIDRKALGAIVFADEKKRMILNRRDNQAVRQQSVGRVEERRLFHV